MSKDLFDRVADPVTQALKSSSVTLVWNILIYVNFEKVNLVLCVGRVRYYLPILDNCWLYKNMYTTLSKIRSPKDFSEISTLFVAILKL